MHCGFLPSTVCKTGQIGVSILSVRVGECCVKNTKYLIILSFFFIILCLARRSLPILTVDAWFFHQAQQLSYSKTWLLVWGVITRFGNGEFVYALAGFVGLAYLKQRPDLRTVGLILFLTLLFLTNPFLKYTFNLPRPVGLSPYYPELMSPSFPSGHAFNAVVLFYFLPRFYREMVANTSVKRSGFSWMLSPIVPILGVTIIASSRIFLGAHWFSDVVGGALWALILTKTALIILRCRNL